MLSLGEPDCVAVMRQVGEGVLTGNHRRGVAEGSDGATEASDATSGLMRSRFVGRDTGSYQPSVSRKAAPPAPTGRGPNGAGPRPELADGDGVSHAPPAGTGRFGHPGDNQDETSRIVTGTMVAEGERVKARAWAGRSKAVESVPSRPARHFEGHVATSRLEPLHQVGGSGVEDVVAALDVLGGPSGRHMYLMGMRIRSTSASFTTKDCFGLIKGLLPDGGRRCRGRPVGGAVAAAGAEEAVVAVQRTFAHGRRAVEDAGLGLGELACERLRVGDAAGVENVVDALGQRPLAALFVGEREQGDGDAARPAVAVLGHDPRRRPCG